MVKIVTSRMPEIEELIEVVKPRSEKEVKEIFPIKFESKEEKNNFKPLHLNDLYDVIKNSELEFDMSKYRRIVEETSMAIPEKGVDPVTWNNMCVITTSATVDHKLGHMRIHFNPSLYVSALVMVSEPVHKVYTDIEYMKLKLPIIRNLSEIDQRKYDVCERFAKKESLSCVIGPKRFCSIEEFVDKELYFNFVELVNHWDCKDISKEDLSEEISKVANQIATAETKYRMSLATPDYLTKLNSGTQKGGLTFGYDVLKLFFGGNKK